MVSNPPPPSPFLFLSQCTPQSRIRIEAVLPHRPPALLLLLPIPRFTPSVPQPFFHPDRSPALSSWLSRPSVSLDGIRLHGSRVAGYTDRYANQKKDLLLYKTEPQALIGREPSIPLTRNVCHTTPWMAHGGFAPDSHLIHT
jgi:hypothetical protein